MPSISTGTTSAVALLTDAVKVPVLAAGGIINEKTPLLLVQKVSMLVQDLFFLMNVLLMIFSKKIF